VLAWFAPPQLVWLAPVLLGLAIAPLASRLSGSVRLGDAFAWLGVFVTPEDRATPPAMARAAALRPAYAADLADLSLAQLAVAPERRSAHLAALDGGETPSDRLVWLAHITAKAKIEAVEDPEAALALLTPDERLALGASPSLIALWARRPTLPPESFSLAGE
jgi:membrane glycosyltransferase